MLKNMVGGLYDLIYPAHCLLCRTHTPAGPLCTHCHELIRPNIPPFCVKCSRFLGKNLSHPKCRQCRHHNPEFDFAWAACLYNDTLKKLIHSFKYYQKTMLRKQFGEWIFAFIERYELDIRQFDYIIPVPLFASRKRERGFNQSAILARMVSERYAILYREDLIKKIRPNESQALLKEKERWTNVCGAFKITNSNICTNKNILIVDDLLTTGATASQTAAILKEAGAQRVGVLTLAITAL